MKLWHTADVHPAALAGEAEAAQEQNAPISFPVVEFAYNVLSNTYD